MALVEIIKYPTPAEGRTAAAKRQRIALHHAVLTRLKRELYGAVGRAGVSCVDANGDAQVLLPCWQGARLDHIEVMASAKIKHCATCEVASKRQLAQHPPRRPLRRAAETQALVMRALAAEKARRQSLAITGAIGKDDRRRTKRRLARLKRKLARRGLHCLPNR